MRSSRECGGKSAPREWDNNGICNLCYSRDLHAQNHSIVYINFGSHKVPQFDQNNLSTWYDQLGGWW